jgi:hypothetical protein
VHSVLINNGYASNAQCVVNFDQQRLLIQRTVCCLINSGYHPVHSLVFDKQRLPHPVLSLLFDQQRLPHRPAINTIINTSSCGITGDSGDSDRS